MKKLLLLGALLTLGATSFALNTQAVSKQSVDVTSGSGAAELQLITKGTVVAPGDNKYMLVITPTQTSEMNNDSIAFNFADIKLGESTQMIGGFKAQIYGNNKGTGTPTGLHLVNIKTYADNITTELEYLGTDDAVDVGVNNESITGIKLRNLADSTQELGVLNYTLTTAYTDNQTLEGEIIANIVAGVTNSGSFRNMETKVVVAIDGATLPTLPNNNP